MNAIYLPRRIVHSLRYRFAAPVRKLSIRARLRPRDNDVWRSTFAQLLVLPEADHVSESRDQNGNHLAEIEISGPLERLDISHVCSIEVVRQSASDAAARRRAEGMPWEALRNPDHPMTRDSRRIQASPAFAEMAMSAFSPGRPIADCIRDFSILLKDRIRYHPTSDRGRSPGDVLDGGRGVCEDFAHLAIAGLRSLGLPSRYVGGYRIPPEEGSSTVDCHAWAAVRLTGDDWLAFDPTFGEFCHMGHLANCWGRDSGDVPLVSGRLGEAIAHTLDSNVVVKTHSIEFDSVTTRLGC